MNKYLPYILLLIVVILFIKNPFGLLLLLLAGFAGYKVRDFIDRK